MTGRAVAVLAVLGALATGLGACAEDGPVPDARAAVPVAGTADGAAARATPAFVGTRQLGLRRGHQVALLGPCQSDPAGHRLCQASGRNRYSAYGTTRTTTLTGAQMRPGRDHTSWVIRLRFDAGSTKALRVSAQEAQDTKEFVLLLDERAQVLAAVDPAAIGGRGVQVGPVTKPEAWALVSALDHP